MVLKNVELDPEYKALMDDLLEQVSYHSEGIDPGMCKRVGFIFVSSPQAITPLHMDASYNFLLQVHGKKTVRMWHPGDREVLPESTLERYFSAGGHHNLDYRDEFQHRAYVHELTPGQGLHFPYLAPHWVKNHDEVSISFSITFQTRLTLRQEKAYI